jgi:hypothetical protein
MTSQTCITSNISTGSHDPAIGLLSHVFSATIEAQIPLTMPAGGWKKAVTFLMARAAPSNYGVKPTAGRSPRPGLKPLS